MHDRQIRTAFRNVSTNSFRNMPRPRKPAATAAARKKAARRLVADPFHVSLIIIPRRTSEARKAAGLRRGSKKESRQTL